MVSTRCAVRSCGNTRYKVKQQNANITFHTFPADQNVCRKWIKFCGQVDSWTPSKQSVVCSAHFKPEDYQLSQLPLHQKRIELRRLQSHVVPSVTSYNPTVKIEFNDSDESQHQEQLFNAKPDATDPMVLKFRDQVCRTCLNHYADESLISVDSEIQHMTVLDMLIQLTAFEVENNDAFPMVICLECKDKLELAYNIRQEFIAQTEHLVQLVAEDKILSYFKKIEFEKSNRLIQSNAQEETIYASMDQTSEIPSNDVLFKHENETFDSDQESLHIKPDNTADDFVVEMLTNQSDTSDPNDQRRFAKVTDEYDDASAECNQNIYLEDSKCTDESVGAEKSPAEIAPADCQIQAMDEKPEEPDTWENFQRTYEQEKASVRKLKAEMRRAERSQKKIKSKAKCLEEEARKRFPHTTCYVCGAEHDTLMERDLHMREHVPMLPYECNECMEPIETSSAQGANDETDPNATVTVNRPTILKTTNQLNAHFRMHNMPHKCEKCYRRFSTVLKLKTHQWALHGFAEKGLTCEYCGKQYYHRAVFRTHIAHHRNELSGQFKCTICDRSFGVKSSLQRHEASHKGERKYKCMYCDKLFSTSYNRLTHQRSHTGERPFKCEICDRSFAQSTAFKAHQKLCPAVEMRPFQPRIRGPALLPSKDGRCPYPGCDYTTTTYAAMYVHKRSKHMPMHQCGVCDKSFAFANNLKDHMMLHTGEKPHKCDQCDRSFRRMEMYRRHMQTHKSDSNHVCTVCQKSFKLPQYLQAHLLTHSVERKFACELCGNSYKTKGELKKHTQRKHADKVIEEIIVKAEDPFEV